MSANDSSSNISIYYKDATGKTVFATSQKIMDLTGIEDGVYLVCLMTTGGNFTKKMVKTSS